MKNAYISVVLTAVLFMLTSAGLVACSDPEKEAKRLQLEKKREKKRVERKAERDAESRLMADHKRGIPELEKRIDVWLNMNGGYYNITEKEYGEYIVMHKVSSNAPWNVKCGDEGISITLGGFTSVDEGEGGPSLGHRLTETKLTYQQCVVLSKAVADKLKHMRHTK